MTDQSITDQPEQAKRPTLEPATRARLVDVVYDQLRASIIGGAFAMGERLVESRLADELGTSRAPIREALRRLQEEGLIAQSPHRGTYVRELSADDLVDLYNARLAIEPVALRLFMRRGASTDGLHEAIEAMKESAHDGEPLKVANAELAFHQRIIEGSANAVLENAFSVMQGQLLLGLAMDDGAYEDLAGVAEEHEPIVELIEAGDEGRAVEEFERHIVGTVGAVLDRLGGEVDRLVVQPQDA